jgi:TolB-like protein/predicted Ser/Thr protein kinase
VRTAIGRYRVERVIGEGGMGVVYGAYDDQLGRSVAIKTIREDTADLTSRERLWREARAAAAVSHPNVCHVYEVAVEGETLYLVMELLAGEPLSARIARGPMTIREAMPVADGVLAALQALHESGIVHRDLKPANIFLTPHGVKLLDFGLARGRGSGPALVDLQVTAPGIVAGTPRYMAPEQLEGSEATPRSDLFTFGTVLFEMLTGKPPFDGSNVWDVSYAILHHQPPALTGDGAAALDAVVHRCLAKRPGERYADAAEASRELRAAVALADSGNARPIRAATRLMVLPFKLLRPDPEIDFLGFSLPDALVASLTGLGPLIVRSSDVGAGSGDALDLRKIAAERQVDAVLTGTLLRSGQRLRLVTQLVDAHAATILWSKTAQVDMGDIFEVQDDLARQIVDALAIPLSTLGKGLLDRAVPANGHAYELYLRANHLAHNTIEPARLLAARELYAACLAKDPEYAPAWARIARVYRVLAKFADTRDDDSVALARDAFQRAFELNPQLPLAHHLYTYFEVENLGQAEAAMTRLLGQVQAMPDDPDLYAGLVVACRYCGLLSASLAADNRARQLDPAAATSVEYTCALLAEAEDTAPFDSRIRGYVLLMYALQHDRLHEVRALMSELEVTAPPIERTFLRAAEAALARSVPDALAVVEAMRRSGFRDPEGWVYIALTLARAGARDEALRLLDESVSGGWVCPEVRRQPWFASLRGDPVFEQIISRAEAGRARAAEVFRAAKGHRLLGMTGD